MNYKRTAKKKFFHEEIRAITNHEETNESDLPAYREDDLAFTKIQLPILVNNIINRNDVENTITYLSKLTQQKSFALNDLLIDENFLAPLSEIITNSDYPAEISVYLIIFLHNIWYYSKLNTPNVFHPNLIIAFTTFYSSENPVILSYAYHATLILIDHSYNFIPLLIENGIIDSIGCFISNNENDKDSFRPIHIIYDFYKYFGENNEILDPLIPYFAKFITSQHVPLREMSTLCMEHVLKSERSFQFAMTIPDILEFFKNAQLLRLLSQSESLYQCYIFLFKHGVNEIFVDTFFDELRETVKKSIDENNLIYSIYEFIRLILPNYWNVLKNYGFIDFFLETTQDRCTELKLEFISCLATYALSVDNAELLEFGQKGGFEAIIEIIYIGYSPYFSVFLKSLIRFLALDNSFVELGNNIQIQDAMESIDTDEQEIQELKQNILSYYVESEE